VAALSATLVPGSTYDITLPTATLDDCAPAENADHTFIIQSGAGGFTYETLNYGADITAGAKVI